MFECKAALGAVLCETPAAEDIYPDRGSNGRNANGREQG